MILISTWIKKNNFCKVYLCSISLLFSFTSYATKIQRLDVVSLEKFDERQSGLFLFVSENCSICLKQLEVLKNCDSLHIEKKIFFTGIDEEKLRRHVKRLNLALPVYWSNAEIEKKVNFTSKTPSIFLSKLGKIHFSREGIMSCKELTAANAL